MKQKAGIIYRAYCKTTEKSYIGMSIRTLHIRKREHLNSALVKNSSNHFYCAIRKYGANAFEWSVIDSADSIEELRSKEIYWIDKYDSYKNGYNETFGGEVFPQNLIGERNKIIQSKEVRNKISIGIKRSYQEHPERYKLLCKRNQLMSNTEEAKQKSSERAKARIIQNPCLMKTLSDLSNTEENKRKRINAMKKYYDDKNSNVYKTLRANGFKTMSNPDHCQKMWTNAKRPEAIAKLSFSLKQYNKDPKVLARKSELAKKQMTPERINALRLARQNAIIKKMNLILDKIEGEVTEEKYNYIRSELKLKDPSFKWYLKYQQSN